MINLRKPVSLVKVTRPAPVIVVTVPASFFVKR